MAEKHPLQDRLDRLSAQIDHQIKLASDWKLSLRHGILVGVGTTIGATILVSILIFILRPFENTVVIGPALDRLSAPRQSR